MTTSPVPENFFVLRTPLLAWDEILQISDDLEACCHGAAQLEAALDRDGERIRVRLHALCERSEVREALFLASPSFEESLHEWQRQPDSERGQKVERALLRYLFRMAGRATPFGLFAGCAVGTTSAASKLAVCSRDVCRRHARLDFEYLSGLCAPLQGNATQFSGLRFRPNSSLYVAAGRLRLARERLGAKDRSYDLVAIEPTPFLLSTLERASQGARLDELAAFLCASDAELARSEAESFVAELVANQILISELAPALTGPEPIHGILAELRSQPAAAQAADALAQAQDGLMRIARRPLGVLPQEYRNIAAGLASCPQPVALSRLFQVDMIKSTPRPELGADVISELARGVDLLRRISGRSASSAADPLRRFREQFQERYAEREVPLCEVLDEESGLGFAASPGSAHHAEPLLREIAFPEAVNQSAELRTMSRRQTLLLAKLIAALKENRREISLTEGDIAQLEETDPLPLPDAFAIVGTLLAPGGDGLAAGNFRVHLKAVSGPSGANLLGRFCHGNEELTEHVRRHLRSEETFQAHALFAEVVHLPEGRLGNVLLRPVLRSYEIPYLGRSGAAPDQHIAVSDLLVSVRAGRVMLRSQRLGQEVIPRLTTAHYYVNPHNLGLYRFLCALQGQGVQTGLSFDWGPLAGSPYLPRVVSGRLVLTLEQWNLGAEQCRLLSGGQSPARFRAVQALRESLALPRFVALVDGDNLLPVDLDNVLSVESCLQLLKNRQRATLTELPVGSDELCAEGPEGRFVHELILPFLRTQPPAADAERPKAASNSVRAFSAAKSAPLAPTRQHPPGSDWIYAKLYTGTGAADQVLREVVGPIVSEALASGAADRWFFIRYGDPEWHLRLRLHGEPQRLCGEVLPALHRCAAPLLADGRIWRIQIDTYEREVERYGGMAALLLSEQLFQYDSEAVLSLVHQLAGDEGAEARWRLCISGADRLLDDLGLDLAQKLAVLRPARDGLCKEFGGSTPLMVSLGDKYRRHRNELEALLLDHRESVGNSCLDVARKIFQQRSVQSAPVVKALEQLALTQALPVVSIIDLGASYVHMHANRILRTAARQQELVLYDFLTRLYESQLARRRGSPMTQTS